MSFEDSYISAAGPTNWTLTKDQCQSRYDSELVPWGYINFHNLSGDLVKELGRDQAGWIDGRVQNLGCHGEGMITKRKITTNARIPTFEKMKKLLTEFLRGFCTFVKPQGLCIHVNLKHVTYVLEVSKICFKLNLKNT